MATRYLFGPVAPEFAERKLHRPRHAGNCLAFNAHGTADLTVGPGDTWDEVCRRLPAGWQPDFVVLHPAYSSIPAGLWSAPVPLVGLAMDWNLLWHHYRRLTACDLILTDAVGVEAFARQGLPQARAANLYGCGRDFRERTWPEGPRDIDVLFVGNLHPAVQRERLPWLGRVARLAGRRRVHIASGVFGEDYRSLLGRARIVFNRSIRSECNQRAFEATTAGALLFQEAGNGETSAYFRDRQESIYYTPDNLEELLDYYLDHEDERHRIAVAGQQRARQLGFEQLWQEVLETILPAEWPGMVERARRRPVLTGTEGLLARTWQVLGSTEDSDPALIPDLCAAVLEEPRTAALHNALGLVVSRKGQGRGPVNAWAADTAVPYFAQAVAHQPEHLMAGLNLVEALVGIGRNAQALEQARKVLATLERAGEPDPSVWESGHFPAVFDHFRVEWERAAGAHAGQPALEIEAKRVLLRWRLHTLLAELTGDLGHYHEAALARPDLPPTRAALGCALARARRFPEAVSHLRQAVADNPFDAGAARALCQALEESGDREATALLAADRRRLARAAPQAVPVEPWFAEASPSPEELASIIVLCHNEVAFTRLCLESVLQHTRPPFELVLVDNGSTDDTAAYLDGLSTRRGPARMVVRRNATNRGFAAGCNQALAEAQGDYLVFLNNDTVVPAGWLEGLTAYAGRDGPRVGLVGPMSNYASGPQLLGDGYGGLEELEAFAARRRRAYTGQALEVGRLTGFCLLVRRKVLECIGGFDERYGLGFFEDDDLCVRAREAGFRLLLAQDVFIHHFGSRTFAHLGVDAVEQLHRNFAQFQAKWGKDHTAGYRLPVRRSQTQAPGASGDATGPPFLAENPGRLPAAAPRAPSVEPELAQAPAAASKPAAAVIDPALAPKKATPGQRLGVVWEGDFWAGHSYARVNREICGKLVERGHGLTICSVEAGVGPEVVSPVVAACGQRPPAGPIAVHIRHRWPPSFVPPPAGHWVLFQPWEYGSLPQAWLGPIANLVDEVWVYTRYVRDCYVRSGVAADRVQVVPLGIDPARYHPQAPPRALRTDKRFKLLFVGGTIFRKGIDVLLEAYTQAFTAADDVCLVIKDVGVGTFYRGATAGERIAECQARPGAPAIEYLDRSLSEDELAGLYTACDCLVHPYRGEGFGLPIAEALACGLPVIVTGYGAALDFCNDRHAYLLPARLVRFAERLKDGWETVDYPWLAEPDAAALRDTLRHVVAHPEEARAKGAAGAAYIRSHFTWDQTADIVEQRLTQLRQRPIRRPTTAPVAVPVPAGAPNGRPARVSLCLIVKNEEANLPACLESAADLVDEIIVVDTGSTDRTKEVAARFGAKVFDFPWVDSFAAARNESLRHATGDWIFWLDADDRLDDANRQRLRAVFAGLNGENVAFAMKCRCLPDPQTGTATVVDHVRLFRNHPQIRWEYRVHEQILPAVRQTGGQVRPTDVVIQHVGYQDAATRKRKQERDLRLLHLDLAERPHDPFTSFNLGWAYEELGQPAEALDFLHRSLERSHPGDSIVRKLYALMAECHRQLGQPAEALAVLQQGRRYYPDDAQLLFQEALRRREQGDREGAEACLLRLLNGQEGPHFASVAEGLRGPKARHQLAVLYREQGRAAEAEALWRTVLAEEPGFGLAGLGLGDILLEQGRWSEVEELGRHLESAAGVQGSVLSAALQARSRLARQEYGPARRLLEKALARFPQAVLLHTVLSHVLLKEGRDWEAAERVLRQILELDPQHAEARRNLDLLRRQQGQPDESTRVRPGPPALPGAAGPAAPPPAEQTSAA